MKKISWLFSLSVVLLFHSCDKPAEVIPLKGSAVFSFFDKDRGTGGRMADVPVPASILLSIEDAEGKSMEKDKKLALQAFGQSYITEEIELLPDSYRLTKFLILDAAGVVIYATPLEGADLADNVDDPLPINFSISQQSNTQVSPQVIAVANDDTPESFGYVSFDFEVVEGISTVSIKANVKMDIGGILYENVDAHLRVKGYDGDNTLQWTKDYNFIGPDDNVLAVKSGLHHYSIELIDKWGVQDEQSNIAAKDIVDGRADGPLPVTYVLTGSKNPKKLTSYVTSRERDIVGVYRPESRVYYNYEVDGRLKYIRYESYNEQKLQYEESFTETFSYQGAKVSKIIGTMNGKYFKELNYTYGSQDKITEVNLNSGITTTLLITTKETNNGGSVAFTFSNGNSLLYEFDTRFKNIISDRTTKGSQLCNKGIYTFDKNINPFQQLGYLDFQFRNWYANNKVTENVDHLACAFPTLIPVTYDYTYDQDGYPTQQITSYRSGYGAKDPISPYHGKVDFYYE